MRAKVVQERYRVEDEASLSGNEELIKGMKALGMLGARVESFHNVSGEDNANRLA